MPQIIQVYAIIDSDGVEVVEVCSTEPLAKEAARAWNDWNGHGSARVVPRQAVVVDGVILLLANDYGPELKLDSTKASKEAALRLSARARLTEAEAHALGLKR